MKKILILMALILSVNAYAKEKFSLKTVDKVIFYGVDFSEVKTFATEESVRDFESAFESINNLFYTEEKKYDLTKFLNKKTETSIDAVIKIIRETNFDDLRSKDNKYEIKKELTEEMIKRLPIEDTEGVGLVLIAELLDKANKKGFYQVVFFDIASREILSIDYKVGKPQGFGLRNFWARSVFEVLKKI